jgi:hypothetical protein
MGSKTSRELSVCDVDNSEISCGVLDNGFQVPLLEQYLI